MYLWSMNDLMVNKHLRFTRYFPYRDDFIVRYTVLHLRTLQIMLSDPNIMCCSPCDATLWFRI